MFCADDGTAIDIHGAGRMDCIRGLARVQHASQHLFEACQRSDGDDVHVTVAREAEGVPDRHRLTDQLNHLAIEEIQLRPRLGVPRVASQHDRRQISVLEHGVHDPAKVGPHLGERLAGFGVEGDLLYAAPDQPEKGRRQLGKYLTLARKVEIEGPARDLGRVDDVVHRRRVITLVPEDPRGGHEDGAAPLFTTHLRAYRPAIGLLTDTPGARRTYRSSARLRATRRQTGRPRLPGVGVHGPLGGDNGVTVAVDSQSMHSLP